MPYKVVFSDGAVKQLRKLDKPIQKQIYNWINKNLEGCEDPRIFGKGLTSNRSGQWRYRIGDYRIIAKITEQEEEQDGEKKKQPIVLILIIGHRSSVYDE